MRFIFHLLGIIYFLIWIVIGSALLIGALAVIKIKPWQMLGQVGNWSQMMGVVNNIGSTADVMQKVQNNRGDVVSVLNSLPKSQQDCLRKEVGEKTVNEVLSGKKFDITPDLIFKAMKCLK